jgi:hypothetical protein
MSIPNSPNWSDITEVFEYPEPSFEKPNAPEGINAVSLGPIELNDSKGKLNSRYWLVIQLNGQVQIQGSNSEWTDPTILFNEPLAIREISLSFDQLGRPLVFYRTEANQLKIYWYDPVIEQNTIATIGEGTSPLAVFDFPQDTNQSFSDILLFYIRDGDIYMRIQRERFSVEYLCPNEGLAHYLIDGGLTTGNRLQVTYAQIISCGYPNITPTEGTLGYLFGSKSYNNSRNIPYINSNKSVNVFTDSFTVKAKIESISQDFRSLVLVGSNEPKFLKVELILSQAHYIISIWRAYANFNVAISFEDMEFITGVYGSIDNFIGLWEISFVGGSYNTIIKYNTNVVYDGPTKKPNNNYNPSSKEILFAGAVSQNLTLINGVMQYVTSHVYGFDGVISYVYLEDSEGIIEANITAYNESKQKYLDDTGEVDIVNHTKNDWVFKKS